MVKRLVKVDLKGKIALVLSGDDTVLQSCVFIKVERIWETSEKKEGAD